MTSCVVLLVCPKRRPPSGMESLAPDTMRSVVIPSVSGWLSTVRVPRIVRLPSSSAWTSPESFVGATITLPGMTPSLPCSVPHSTISACRSAPASTVQVSSLLMSTPPLALLSPVTQSVAVSFHVTSTPWNGWNASPVDAALFCSWTVPPIVTAGAAVSSPAAMLPPSSGNTRVIFSGIVQSHPRRRSWPNVRVLSSSGQTNVSSGMNAMPSPGWAKAAASCS